MGDLKSMKKIYKLKPPDMGIYQVKNLESGRIYIGRAMDLNGKFNSERFQLKNNLHMNKELQRDFNELGEGMFSFEALDRLKPREALAGDPEQDLRELEALWLEKLQPFGAKGYNRKKC